MKEKEHYEYEIDKERGYSDSEAEKKAEELNKRSGLLKRLFGLAPTMSYLDVLQEDAKHDARELLSLSEEELEKIGEAQLLQKIEKEHGISREKLEDPNVIQTKESKNGSPIVRIGEHEIKAFTYKCDDKGCTEDHESVLIDGQEVPGDMTRKWHSLVSDVVHFKSGDFRQDAEKIRYLAHWDLSRDNERKGIISDRAKRYADLDQKKEQWEEEMRKKEETKSALLAQEEAKKREAHRKAGEIESTLRKEKK